MEHKGKSGFFKAKQWMTRSLRYLFEAVRLPRISDAKSHRITIKATVQPCLLIEIPTVKVSHH